MNKETLAPFVIEQRIRNERSKSHVERSQIQIQIDNSESDSWHSEDESKKPHRGSCTISDSINLDSLHDNCVFIGFSI